MRKIATILITTTALNANAGGSISKITEDLIKRGSSRLTIEEPQQTEISNQNTLPLDISIGIENPFEHPEYIKNFWEKHKLSPTDPDLAIKIRKVISTIVEEAGNGVVGIENHIEFMRGKCESLKQKSVEHLWEIVSNDLLKISANPNVPAMKQAFAAMMPIADINTKTPDINPNIPRRISIEVGSITGGMSESLKSLFEKHNVSGVNIYDKQCAKNKEILSKNQINPIINNLGGESIITKISISNMNLNDCFNTLITAISDSKLKELELSFSTLNLDQLKMIAVMLVQNTSLTSLTLMSIQPENEKESQEGFSTILRALEHNNTLKKLALGMCRINNLDTSAIMPLTQNKSLVELDLSQNNLSKSNFMDIFSCLQNNKNIEKLALSSSHKNK